MPVGVDDFNFHQQSLQDHLAVAHGVVALNAHAAEVLVGRTHDGHPANKGSCWQQIATRLCGPAGNRSLQDCAAQLPITVICCQLEFLEIESDT